MSVELLEEAATALGALGGDVVFLGAATLPLWITDPAAPPLRTTADVDVVVEVTTLIAYDEFEQRLRQAGFRDEGETIGRFLFGAFQTGDKGAAAGEPARNKARGIRWTRLTSR